MKKIFFSVFLLFGFFIKFKYSSYASNNWTYSYTSYYLGGNKVEFPILALRDKSNNVAVFIHVPYSKFIVGENEENIKDCEIIDRKYAYIQYSRFYNKFTYSLCLMSMILLIMYLLVIKLLHI